LSVKQLVIILSHSDMVKKFVVWSDTVSVSTVDFKSNQIKS